MSDLDPSQTKAPPEALVLRAKPRPVTRLSKRALALLLGGASVIVLGGAIWALRPPKAPQRAAELYSTDRRATAEGLAALPSDYAGVRAAGVPKLGPPVPGDLGAPILAAQADGRLPPGATPVIGPTSAPDAAAEQARQVRLKAAHDAIASPLLAASSQAHPASATATPSASTSATDTAGLLQALVSTPVQGATMGAAQTLARSRHEAFAEVKGDDQVVSARRLQPPASPYTVMSGTLIPAALVTGLNSDLPGQVIATVTAPVFDTVTGQILLIPQGAKLLGTYDSQTSFGDSRALVVWTRLLLPNGRSVILDRQSAVDGQGQAGLSDQVDHHWRRLIGGAAVSTLLGIGAELATPQSQTSNGQVVIALRNGVQDTTNQVGQELTRRTFDTKPTLMIRPGYTVRVLVYQDLVLEPYASGS